MRFYQTKPNTRLLMLLAVPCVLAIAALLGTVVTARSDSRPAVTVTIVADGQTWDYVSSQGTVGGILQEAGIGLGAKDRVFPTLKSPAFQGTRIRVTRVIEQVVIQKEPIKFKRVVKFDPRGRGERVIQKGQLGEKEIRYVVTFKDGVKAETRVVGSRVTKQPVKEVVALTKQMILASRSGSYMRSISMSATGYAPHACGGSASGRAALGMHAGYGIVAVDPRVIPLGTKLYVEGYGFCLAGDTGGAIKGARIDLGFDTYSQALSFGRRRVTVYVIEE